MYEWSTSQSGTSYNLATSSDVSGLTGSLYLTMFLLATVIVLASFLNAHAQAHAVVLATSETLYHSDLSPLLTRCDWAGETIFRGGDPEDRWAAYQASPTHAHVVNFPWTHHGEGRALAADGRWVVVDVFCVASVLAPVVSIPPTTVPVAPIITAPPLIVPPPPPLRTPVAFCDPSSTVRVLCVN